MTAVNLLTTVQKNLGYPVLKKVDPNTQEVKKTCLTPDEERLGQAGIPSILAGINNLAKSDKGCAEIAGEDLSADWLDLLFGENKASFISNVCAYSLHERSIAGSKLNEIAKEAIRLIREHSRHGQDLSLLKKFIADQRNHFYPFLPAAINVGLLVNDDTIDDRTHKMEGPISSLMHKIEHGFGNSQTADDVAKKKENF